MLCVLEMLCTDSRHGRFFGGLDWDWDVSRCRRKFYAATADGRKRKFRLACDPPAEGGRAQGYGAEFLVHKGHSYSACILLILVDRS